MSFDLTKMDQVYKELDEAKAEIEQLKIECKTKGEISERLKRGNSEQIMKINEANSTIEKLNHKLFEKEDEISSTNQLCEDLKSKLKERDVIFKQLSSANEKLRINRDEKVNEYELEKKGLVSALDEMHTKCLEQEIKISSLSEELERVKEGFLSVSAKKKVKRDDYSNDLRKRDDLLSNLEEEKRKFEDELKWKKEQFNHLKEAHEKVKKQYELKEKEWENERISFLNEIMNFETKLNSQIQISEDYKKRLQICNEALVHKETEYQLTRLKQENEELIQELKQFHEAEIKKNSSSSSSSVIKLKNKLRSMKQLHKEQSEQLMAEIESKNISIQQLESKVEQARLMFDEMHDSKIQLEEELKSMREELDQTNEELDEKFCELNESEYELQIWKSITEQLKASLEDNRKMRRDLEASLLAEAEIETNLKLDKEKLLKVIEEKDETINRLMKGNLVNVEVEEEKRLHYLVEERDKRINDLTKLVGSLEKEFNSSTSSFGSKLITMQVEINKFRGAWENITKLVVLKEVEIEERNLIINELECEVKELEEKREDLLGMIDGLFQRISMLSGENLQLTESLGTLVQTFDSDEEVFDPRKENVNDNHLSPIVKKVEGVFDGRLPFRSLNN